MNQCCRTISEISGLLENFKLSKTKHVVYTHPLQRVAPKVTSSKYNCAIIVNTVAQEEFATDDPGLIVELSLNMELIHQALGDASSPVEPGVDPLASAQAFRDWLITRALQTPGCIGPDAQVSNSLVFQHRLVPCLPDATLAHTPSTNESS